MGLSLIRYPGGKSKLANIICQRLAQYPECDTYCEPFFGGGSVGLQFLQNNSTVKNIWINDYNLGIAALWTSIINCPEWLKSLVESFVPNLNDYFDFKQDLIYQHIFPSSFSEQVMLAFKKLALHQMSYSGLGEMSGGPIGGINQELAKYKIGCRWSPNHICQKIDELHKLLTRYNIYENKCTYYYFQQVVYGQNNKTLIYLDPPYYVKGNTLYLNGLSTTGHRLLSHSLQHNCAKWVLSYDNCSEIRELYKWANIEEINVNYTIRSSHQKSELLITP
jgi:DNA adenine methylase